MRDSDWPGTLEGVPVQPAIIGVERRGILDISSYTTGERAKFYSFKRAPRACVRFFLCFGSFVKKIYLVEVRANPAVKN